MKPGASSGRGNRKEHSFALTSAPSDSLVKVESIFIDIVADEKIKPKKCEHFTIRGFVSDSREQNEKLCSPLFVDADTSGSKEVDSTLYPLHAPQFKSWQCQNCLNDLDAAAGKKGSHNISVSCSKQLKAKGFCSQRSLENVVAYLSEKLKKTSELGRSRSLCQKVKSTSKFKQKQKQKQKYDSAFHSTLNGREENELRDEATGFISNRQDSLPCVDEHQKKFVRPSRTPTSSKFNIVDDSQQKSRHGAATKLVQLQHDDSVGTGCRKTKAKKVRLLNEILEKDGRDALPVVTKCFHADEPAKASCSASQGLQKFQLDNVKCQVGQKTQNRNKSQEQDRNLSQMHHANTVDGNCDRRKAKGNSAIASELHMISNDGHSNQIIEQTDKMFFGGKQRADEHKNHPHGHNKSFLGQDFHARVAEPSDNGSMPHSQFKGKPNNTIHKVNAGANLLSSTGYGRRPEENNVAKKRLEKFQTGQAQCYQHTQDVHSSRQHYSFAEGWLDPRNGTEGWFPGVQNGNLRNDTRKYMGESSSACKSFVDKNIHQDTNNISALKRPNPGPCSDSKKPKHSRRNEGGPTVVHRTEHLLRNNSNKKMSGMRGNPESTLCKIRGSVMQEGRTADDIPMEIVELMAKNQYERHLHQAGDGYHEQQSGSYRKKDIVARTSMLPSDVSQLLHEKPHIPSARITFEENLGISNRKPIGKVLQRPNGSTHRPLIPSQQEMSGVPQFPAIGSSKANMFEIRNSKYDLNKLAYEQGVPFRSHGQFELWRPTFQRSDRIDRPWPMVPPNNPVHKPSVPQGSAFQSFNFGEVPKCSSYAGEGLAFSNIALAGEKTNNIRPEASHTPPQMTGAGSPDPYANEAISALNLLSLMNGRPQSSTEINMDTVSNRLTFDRSFSNDHLSRELSGNSFAVGNSGHKRKQSSPYIYQSKHPQSDASCRCSPPVPTFSSAAASLHGDVGDKRGVQPPSHRQERGISNVNPGGSHLPMENKNIIYQQSPRTVGVAFQQLIPAYELANHIFSPPWPVPGSNHLYINGSLNGYSNLMVNESYDTLAKRAERGVCFLNRNPMEFSTPGPGNEFMIDPEELKLRKAYPPKFTSPMAASSFKQRGFIKYAAPNNRL